MKRGHRSGARFRCGAGTLVALVLPAAMALGPSVHSSSPPDFQRDIRPLFARSCLGCHGPEQQKSGYRLDRRAVALAGGKSGQAAVVPHDASASPLVRYVSGEDPEMTMPPAGSAAPRLSTAEVELLRAWIEGGAVWPESPEQASRDSRLEHWAFRPLAHPPVPTSTNRNPVDAFIRAKLAGVGLAPAPAADRRTLLRRLSFDLAGLPPSPADLATLQADPDPQAYEKQVDRLLASPRYGERWARHWFDVVRYGETHGYDKDQPRLNAWPYRDYVIRALHQDKPYARFVLEQLAGDVLFPDTVDGMEALGFIAAGPWDLIGHAELPESKIDGKVARHLDRDDMVANTINTFCSVTVHCAQCHDHKFDPVPQEDYYRLQAVFAALDRADKRYDPDPEIGRRRAALEATDRELGTRRNDLSEQVKRAGGAALAELERQIADAEKAASQGRRPEYGWHSAIAAEPDARKWVQVDLGGEASLDRVVLAPCWDDFNGIGAGFGFPVRFRVEAGDDPAFAGPPVVLAAHDLVDYPNPGTAPRVFNAGGQRARYVRVTATRLAPRQGDFIFALAELEVYDTRGTNVALQAAVTSLDSIEAPVRWSRQNLTDGVYPAATGGDAALAELRRQRAALLLSVTSEALRAEIARVEQAQAEAKAELAKLPPPRFVYAGTVHSGSGNFVGTGAQGGRPRPIHVLARGDVQRPGRLVEPGALSCVDVPFALPPDASEGARRVALAYWITDPRNPLTWRSMVNRVWQYHFGRGLVDTPNDFGHMGEAPSHPELLDWLAGWFRDEAHGSLKALHRLLVTSETYRQRSDVRNPAAEARDADNRLWWRQNRRKLEAEAVRDSLLEVAGKLDLEMGGPSFQDFVIQRPEHSPHYEYHLADPEDPKLHRRSIYRLIVRSQPQPWMAALDCADPSQSVDKRNQTLTPLQALAQLNNALTVAMARHFAERVGPPGTDPGAAIDEACRLALARPPTEFEARALGDYAQKHGLANACRVILNLNEFVFVD